MTIINFERYIEEVNRINEPVKAKLVKLLKQKINRVNEVRDKGQAMTQKQFQFVKIESEFIDTLIYFMQLEENKVNKMLEIFADYNESHAIQVFEGAAKRMQLQLQEQFIKDLQRQNKLLIEIAHERIK